jgi:hypothetical protein
VVKEADINHMSTQDEAPKKYRYVSYEYCRVPNVTVLAPNATPAQIDWLYGHWEEMPDLEDNYSQKEKGDTVSHK